MAAWGRGTASACCRGNRAGRSAADPPPPRPLGRAGARVRGGRGRGAGGVFLGAPSPGLSAAGSSGLSLPSGPGGRGKHRQASRCRPRLFPGLTKGAWLSLELFAALFPAPGAGALEVTRAEPASCPPRGAGPAAAAPAAPEEGRGWRWCGAAVVPELVRASCFREKSPRVDRRAEEVR